MIWQPEFTDKTLSRKPGAVQFSSVVTISFRAAETGDTGQAVEAACQPARTPLAG
ncbi:hypothetical protein MS8345_B00042 (plasmid) [Escherichia coli]|nr:hypothetical protein MS8345_B00042 [Escherichia coli]